MNHVEQRILEGLSSLVSEVQRTDRGSLEVVLRGGILPAEGLNIHLTFEQQDARMIGFRAQTFWPITYEQAEAMRPYILAGDYFTLMIARILVLLGDLTPIEEDELNWQSESDEPLRDPLDFENMDFSAEPHTLFLEAGLFIPDLSDYSLRFLLHLLERFAEDAMSIKTSLVSASAN